MGKHKKFNTVINIKDTPIAQLGQIYCICTRTLGNRRFDLTMPTGENKVGHLRGKIKKNKRSWVAKGVYVLVSMRSFEDKKVDILYNYSVDEVNYLDRIGEISKDWGNSVICDDSDKIDSAVVFETEPDDDCAFDIDEI
jgi:initiation factor 1A